MLWNIGTAEMILSHLKHFKKTSKTMPWTGVAVPMYRIRKLRFRCPCSLRGRDRSQSPVSPDPSVSRAHVFFPPFNALLCPSRLLLCSCLTCGISIAVLLKMFLYRYLEKYSLCYFKFFFKRYVSHIQETDSIHYLWTPTSSFKILWYILGYPYSNCPFLQSK